MSAMPKITSQGSSARPNIPLLFVFDGGGVGGRGRSSLYGPACLKPHIFLPPSSSAGIIVPYRSLSTAKTPTMTTTPHVTTALSKLTSKRPQSLDLHLPSSVSPVLPADAELLQTSLGFFAVFVNARLLDVNVVRR